jgi:ubiquinone/menaquinone biosynthesis C-methylase UbiE
MGTGPDHAVYTHGHHESVLRGHRLRTAENSAAYLLARLGPDTRLLDVGCGPGTITADLAGRVAHVTAVEVSAAVVELARAEMAARRVDNVDLLVGDVTALGLPDDGFDVVHAHQVLQHVGDPVGALREMRRVCRPGGVVAARDADYGAFTWYPAVPEIDEWLALYRAAASANGAEPDAGRRLLSWAQRAGFREVTTTSSTWCFATPAERDSWAGMWADRVVESDLARQLVTAGAAVGDDLRRIAAGWRRWAEEPDGWFSVLHGEILATA